MPNGKSGASGPNAVSLVAKGQNSERELAVERSLEAMRTVLEIPHRRGSAKYQNAKVILIHLQILLQL